jgi:phenylalanyl-tRNA synthetase beta chain
VDFGIINRALLSQFEIEQDVFYADFHWSNVLRMIEHHEITYTELPKFPEVRRDLALLLDKNIRYKQVKEIALQTEKQILKKVGLFDVFEDEKIGKGKKSYAVSFILQDEKSTLTEKQIEQVMSRLIKAFETQLGAKIR